jgi:hypothetical protein
MKSLRIIRIKPNPSGKDRVGRYIPAAQLAAEWVDFQNDGTEPFLLDGIALYHLAYQPQCRDPRWETVQTFSGTLQPQKIVRVHSGEKLITDQMYPEDVAGVDHHVFTGRRIYVWNNDCGDSAALYNGKAFEDQASYDPYPPEGVILHRQGDKLVP